LGIRSQARIDHVAKGSEWESLDGLAFESTREQAGSARPRGAQTGVRPRDWQSNGTRRLPARWQVPALEHERRTRGVSGKCFGERDAALRSHRAGQPLTLRVRTPTADQLAWSLPRNQMVTRTDSQRDRKIRLPILQSRLGRKSYRPRGRFRRRGIGLSRQS
jgi:hypothetical protein